MSRIAAVTACPTGIAHTEMAAEALKKAAAVMGHEIKVETQGSAGTKNILSAQDIAAADVILLAADIRVDPVRFTGKPIYETNTSEAIRNTRHVLEAALAHAAAHPATIRRQGPPETPPPAEEEAELVAAETEPTAPEARPTDRAAATTEPGKRLVGITSCPTGIAHTFMAANALEKAAKSLGHSIKVETQGSVGAQNQLTPEDIAAADAVVIAADTKVDTSRFAGKPVYMTSTKAAMHNGQEVIRTALTRPVAAGGGAAQATAVEGTAAGRSAQRTGPYKHLMTGVSYMLPFVVAGGLAIALAFAVGGIDAEGTLAAALLQIGQTAFGVFIAVLAAYISYSIADRPGLAPGFIGGLLANTLEAGFLGAILVGFLAGYLTKLMADKIPLPAALQGLKPVLILPFLSSIIVGLLMIFLIGPPVEAINAALTAWLEGMRGASAFILGLILGAMMAFDMGGPVNKAAYAFSVGLLTSEVYAPMAAVMAAGMTPPLGLALAAWLFKRRFTEEEREAAPAAGVMGLSFITEGAIPFAAEDPIRVIPSLMLGSAVAGALSMLFGVELVVPHGGIFAVFIPGAVRNLLLYLVAIAAGTLVTTGALFVLKKRPVAELAEEPAEQPEERPVATRA